jgi:hypothetical protein
MLSFHMSEQSIVKLGGLIEFRRGRTADPNGIKKCMGLCIGQYLQ